MANQQTDSQTAQQTVFVLDGHGLLYQLFHALPPMSSSQGEPVGAVYGLAKDLFHIIEKHKPDFLFCAFDLPEATFRNKLYAEYKANRSAMPDDLRPQIESAKELLTAFHVPILTAAGFEADDVLAAIANLASQRQNQCVIVTADKDCRQLINENVSLFNLRKQMFYREEELLADWRIKPEQVVDFQAIVGDSTDNVPGVSGIGPKGAAELLNQYGTLEGIYEHLDEIKGKKRDYLADNKELALLSRQLVRLENNVPIEIDWQPYQGFDTGALRTLFQRFGFKSLLGKIETANRFASFHSANPPANHPVKNSLFSDDWQSPVGAADFNAAFNAAHSAPTDVNSVNAELLTEQNPKGQLAAEYVLIDNDAAFADFLPKLQQQSIFSFDTETVPIENRFEATMPRYTNIAGMSFAWNKTDAYYLAFRSPLGAETLNLETTLRQLKPIFENADVKKVGQNIKYDRIVLRNAGVLLRGIAFDTMIADYLLRPEEPHNLDDMAEYYLGHKTIKIEQLIGSGKKQKRIDEVPTEHVAEYAGEDALVTWRIYEILYESLNPKIPQSKLSQLYYNVELALLEILADMEYTGIAVDLDELKTLSKMFTEKLTLLEDEIYKLAGHRFNIASPKQLAAVLFDELALPISKKTKTGASTDVEVLETLAEQHPLPSKVLEHRQFSKLKGTYVDALPELIHPVTKRIHSSFNQVITATGRLSSSNPNLQNIPVRTAEGKAIRNAFKPGEGFDYLLSCDYSQIELRVLAHFSGDASLCEAFRNGEDIHTRVAAEVFSVSPDAVDSTMRRTAKAVNFGVIYGQTAFGLSKQLGIDVKEAQTFIDGYFARYAGIQQYLNSILDGCMEKGYVETLFGRRRLFRHGTIRPQRKDLNQAERMAINTVIQGTAADLMKQAMVRLARKPYPANLILQIHDELVFEVKKEHADEVRAYTVQTMLLDQPLNVPLVVDAELSEHWK